ncbi:MAG: cation diffusion facilitator family transporter [Gammaproteobacteria bacterium RIFCSPHIGHO2_12_FULL_38_11]|nr:MAG: cation diffusion facilitator family transporter [Gammaproteobacteria bacterium RIFCSPHIGHO2_12_FULL_38_11]
MKNNHTGKTILIVSLINALINALLAVLKIIVGKIGHSQALIADGIHSFSDLMSDTFVFLAARAGANDPDKEHPYGHQRIETIATILIALILLIVGGSIGYEAVHRIFYHGFKKPTLPVIIIAIVSIIANEALFHYSKNQGEKINSNLLISNAWHKRSDVFVSLIVLISVLGSLWGLPWLDAVGAFFIALLIIKMAFKMIWQSVQELIDHAVDELTLAEIKKVIRHISGVKSIHQLRTRLHGSYIFVDLHIIVDPHISVSEGHHIGEEVHAALLKNIKNLFDVTVHIDPENDETAHPSLHLPNREKLRTILAKHWSSLPHYKQIQKINMHYLAGQLTIEIFMPLDAIENCSAEKLSQKYQEAVHDVHEISNVMIYYVHSHTH